ncbi:putative argonaut-like protein [Leptomonas seymouri]|uniref:Putative argonaut-like protein n=1 Tax=Leptomonas seymouri TaxID=5684 RepID=A0A0N0P8H9_LEPSE|nr:putative argonaut-like protein [Leptomonas seymouri]|eukprot:KPI89547.1 putative argonaut-like protein [Leptomonas seymouri]
MRRFHPALVHGSTVDLYAPRVTPLLCSAHRQLYGRAYADHTNHRGYRGAESGLPAHPQPFHGGAAQRSPETGKWGRRSVSGRRGNGGGQYARAYCRHGQPVHHPGQEVAFDGDYEHSSQRDADGAVTCLDASLSKHPVESMQRVCTSATAVATATSCRSFWSQRVRHVPAYALKRQHIHERAEDKRSRFFVRSRLRDDGALSNLFPILFHDEEALKAFGEKHDSYLYIYEMYVTRTAKPRIAAATAASGRTAPWSKRMRAASASAAAQLPNSNQRAGASRPTTSGTIKAVDGALKHLERRVAPGRSWQAIQRYLRHRFTAAASTLLPPLIQLGNKIYAAAPLPADALQLPKTYFDLGWKTAELRLVGRSRYTDMPADELQMVMNKIVLHIARETQVHQQQQQQQQQHSCDVAATKDPSCSQNESEDGLEMLAVVREKTGKLVCTMQGVSSGGLRIYRGVCVQAIFVDHAAALDYEDNAKDEGEGEGDNAHDCNAAPPGASGRVAKKGAANTAARLPPPPTTRHLSETPVGLTDASSPVHFRVEAFLRAFTYRGTPVESYRISDASGSVLASLWAPPQPQALIVGGVYSAAPVRIREFAERGNARLMELPSGTVPKLLAAPQPSPPPSEAPNAPQRSRKQRSAASITPKGCASGTPSRLPGHISLKIDTKGTMASEVSLWEEVLQHYGAGPYDEATQQRIQRALAHMPVVISFSLRQGIVREVRFDGAELLLAAAADPLLGMANALTAPAASHLPLPSAVSSPSCAAAMSETGALSRGPHMGSREPRLLPLLPYLDAQQPCAVLADHTVVPLQVLHCCYDPTMKGWQDISVAVLSLMPNARMQLLDSVRRHLSKKLRRWGIEVASRPWRTKSLSLLPAPMKCVLPKSAARFTAPPSTPASPLAAAAFPSTIVVLGIAGPRSTADQVQRVSLTAQHTAQCFRTNLVACITDESAGVQYVHDKLMTSTPAQQHPGGAASLCDVNSCVILVTTEPDTRATRWLKVECMSRGIHIIAIPPSSSPKRLNVLCASLRRQIATQFELDPLRGIDLRGEVPVLGQRRVLIIGVDTCHTNTRSVGTIVGIFSTPISNHLLSHFWQHNARGHETSHVAVHFKNMLEKALMIYGGVDEVIVFQDGDVFSELAGMKEELAAQLPGCGLTFMCLHKRCNIRFTHTSSLSSSSEANSSPPNEQSGSSNASVESGYHNLVKGVVITALAPIPLDYEVAAPSFYLQAHDSPMSTARAVQYTVHHVSPTLDVADVQQMANVMANVLAPQATKLPMSTRCAHRLASRAERLLDAVPQFTGEVIPRPLSDRLWFL